MKIRQLSLRQQLVWSALVCFLVPLGVNYVVTNYFTKDLILEKAVISAEDSLKAVQSDVGGIIDQTLELSNIVLTNSGIRQLLLFSQHDMQSAEQREDFLVNYSRLVRFLDDLFAQNGDFYVTVLGKNGLIYTNYSHIEFNPVTLYEQPWFSELDRIPAFSTYWTGLQHNYFLPGNASSYLVTIGRPIRTTSSSPVGYVVVSVNERKIRSMLANTPNQEMMLLNEEGVVISHTDPEKIGTRLDWWKRSGDSRTIGIDGENYVYVEKKLHNNENWRLVNLIPLSSALAKNKQVLFISFTLQFLFFTVFCILLTLVISAITRPIAELSRFVTNIGRGQLNERSGIRGQHEVGQLGRTIDHMLDRIQSMIEQITVEQAKKRKAELEMLQAQINPHFMFNLLNSIRLNILIQGDKENADLIGSLSSLLRMTITRDNEFITLREEVDTVCHYVRLMNFRHANQVRLDFQGDDDTGNALVPRFMIQPLIENAIIHGFEQYDGQIAIESDSGNDGARQWLRIAVRDNGIGMTEARLNELRSKLDGSADPRGRAPAGFSGIGVTNVFQRLRLIYGDRFQMEMKSEPNVGTEIALIFPLEYGRVDEHHVDGDSSG
ncbi:sensor histidine kinase [Paenibacillus sp. CECT 9249]|uniref:cache domain-containing sensor histidine kinase n=1 Tax=unclassified Paenibacillus TaxID=185978 RepID=UPI001C11EB84|nr:sensor histidine kinase [Paenibacillus sp. CECT 9249]MBU5440773.1 sensor histidine kinase [Paenibacillus sp. MSJ-34]CAH0120371.1 hypothetical protein PAE9249_02890 [Paenibacillus sp. CECT 9249]